MLDDIRTDDLWPHATDAEQGILPDVLLEHVEHLAVQLQGAPPLRVAYHEVGLKDSGLRRVGGGIATLNPRHRGGWIDLARAAQERAFSLVSCLGVVR